MKNKWERRGDSIIIFMNGKTSECIVDEKALEVLQKVNCTWYGNAMTPKIYACAHIKGKKVTMHRFLMGAKKGDVIDHIDGNTLNNRYDNLRNITHRGNLYNRKSAKNVKFASDAEKRLKPWRVIFKINGKDTSFGSYATESEALEKAKEIRKTLVEQEIKH